MPCCIRVERTAPHKRNMVARRRRLIPRVMQCPRQEYVWMESKRFNAGPANLAGAGPVAETGTCGPRSCGEGGVVLQIVPRRPRPRRMSPCGRAVRRVAWPRRPPGIAPFSPCRRSALFRARRVRLARRDQHSGRCHGPHRLRQPCRLRRPVKPREPSGQIGVTQPQGRLGGIGEVLLHDGKT